MENNNKLIAEFMEFQYTSIGWYDSEESLNLKGDNTFDELKFHTDWNWLMPVIDKIESMGYWVDYTKGDVFIYDDNYNLVIPNPMHENEDTKLSIHYKEVVEFINWYNKKK
jgi:hypothetical protein